MDTRPIRPARRPHWHRPRPAIRRWSIDPVIRSEDYRTYRCYVCRQRLDGREINEPYVRYKLGRPLARRNQLGTCPFRFE